MRCWKAGSYGKSGCLPAAEADALMPPDLQKSHSIWEKNYRTGETWWTASSFSDARHDSGGMNVAEMAPDTEGATMATAEVRQRPRVTRQKTPVCRLNCCGTGRGPSSGYYWPPGYAVC